MPRTAVAAATSGLTRWVRPPLPWRPSKFRFDVDALRSPGASWSGFMPRHIEQPARRHSAPAAVNTWSRPSALGLQAHPRRPWHDQHPHALGHVAPLDDARGGAQVLDPPVGARAEEDGVDVHVTQGSAGLQAHVLQGPPGVGLVVLVGHQLGVGHGGAERCALTRVGAPGDERRERGRVDDDLLVELGVVVAAQVAPRLDGAVPLDPGRGMVAAAQVVVGGVVGGDHAGAGAGLDRHVAHRHPGFHRQGADGAAAELEDVALTTTGADPGDHREHDVLGGDAVAELAVDGDRHRPERLQRQGLGGEHVLDLGGADAEGQGAERPVRGGVAVAADDGHARLGEAQLRADHVHDALLGVAHRKDRDAELLAVAAQGLDLGAAHRVGDRAGRGGDVVVLGGEGEVGAAHRAPAQAQPVERLRAGDLVQQVEVDVEQVGLTLAAAHHVRLPHLLGQCSGHCNTSTTDRPVERSPDSSSRGDAGGRTSLSTEIRTGELSMDVRLRH